MWRTSVATRGSPMTGAGARADSGEERCRIGVRLWHEQASTAKEDYARVIELHRKNKATLGPLPYAAFADAGASGRLMLGMVNGEVCGYVLYGTPRQQLLKLVHVCVGAQARGSGLAKAMVDAVIASNPGRTTISAHCRVDYQLDGFWRSLDMAPTGHRPGRALKGSTLTIWTRRIGQLDLLEAALYDSDNPLAVLDTNVVVDLFASEEMHRPDRVESHGLTADWLVDLVDLAISPEVEVDVGGLQPTHERDTVRRHMSELVTVRREVGMRATAAELLRRMPPELTNRDSSLASDAKHLADAILAKAEYFVSRDENLITATRGWAHAQYGIDVLRPVDLIRQFNPPTAPTAFRSGHLESVGLRWAPLPSDIRHIAERFVNTQRQEKGTQLRRALQAVLSRPDFARVDVLTDDRDREWALVATQIDDDTLSVPVLRVARGFLGETISFQLVRYLRSLALERGLDQLSITDPILDSTLQVALERDGLIGSPPTAHLARHPSDADVSHLRTNDEVADYERTHWPQVILERDVPTWIVPIQPRFARELIGFNPTLIQTRDRLALGFAREFVYFASPTMRRWNPPCRVLWYVTKDPGSTDAAAVRAIVAHSRVVDAQVLPVDDAVARYHSLGVLRGREIESYAQKGKVLVLRFEDTQQLDVPIGRKTLYPVLESHGITRALLTTRAATPPVFDELLRTQPGWEHR